MTAEPADGLNLRMNTWCWKGLNVWIVLQCFYNVASVMYFYEGLHEL